MASRPATVRARIRVNFMEKLLGAQVARMQMLLLGMTGRYNFRVIITKYISKGTGNGEAHRLEVSSVKLG